MSNTNDPATDASVSQITTDTALEKQQKINQAYEELKRAYDTQQPVEVEITDRTRAGFKTAYKDISLFLAFSAYAPRRNAITDEEQAAAIGSKIMVKVKDYIEDEFGKNVKINHREVLEDAKWKDIAVGNIAEATVKVIVKDKGIVVDLLSCGLEAFIPVSFIHNQRVNNIEDFVTVGDTVKGEIVEIDRANNRVIISLKAVPSEKVLQFFDNTAIGDKVKGRAESITNSMVFFNIAPEVTGVLRPREVSWTLRHLDLSTYFEIGKEYELEVINIDRASQKVELSYKRTQPDNWAEVSAKYQVGMTYSAVVEYIPPTGRGAELTINKELDAFMPKPRAGALYNGNKPTFKTKDVIQVKVFNKDAEKHSILVESALKQEGNYSRDEDKPKNMQRAQPTKHNSFTLGDLLSESSKKALNK